MIGDRFKITLREARAAVQRTGLARRTVAVELEARDEWSARSIAITIAEKRGLVFPEVLDVLIRCRCTTRSRAVPGVGTPRCNRWTRSGVCGPHAGKASPLDKVSSRSVRYLAGVALLARMHDSALGVELLTTTDGVAVLAQVFRRNPNDVARDVIACQRRASVGRRSALEGGSRDSVRG